MFSSIYRAKLSFARLNQQKTYRLFSRLFMEQRHLSGIRKTIRGEERYGIVIGIIVFGVKRNIGSGLIIYIIIL